MEEESGVKTRQCGSCTECCRGWLNSRKMNLSPGNPCRYCTDDGCGIYQNRPEDPCKRFHCGWILQPDRFPEFMRPDRCGAIVKLNSSWSDWRVIQVVATGEQIPEETLKWLQSYARTERIPTIFTEYLKESGVFRGSRQRGFGPPEFAEAIKSAINQDDVFF